MISLPLFNEQPGELKTVMDQWLYLLKHLITTDRLPIFSDKKIFGLIFDIGEIWTEAALLQLILQEV